jgi:hypothetical protein
MLARSYENTGTAPNSWMASFVPFGKGRLSSEEFFMPRGGATMKTVVGAKTSSSSRKLTPHCGGAGA